MSRIVAIVILSLVLSIAEGSEPSGPSVDDEVKSESSTQFKSKFYSSVRSLYCLLSTYPYCVS